jgi:hypothetical protein
VCHHQHDMEEQDVFIPVCLSSSTLPHRTQLAYLFH